MGRQLCWADIKAPGGDAFFRRIVGLLERFDLKEATLCINGDPAVRAHLGDHILLRDDDESGEGFWFGLASELTTAKARNLQENGQLVIPAINTFRYDEATHREDAKADAARLLEAGVDGFQIDSVYRDDFPK